MSGASIDYHLRPNKHVERHLFVDLLDHVDRWKPLNRYLYVGFGGIYFEDFKLLHSHFNITKMLSIENEKWVYERQKFNVPYGCIQPRHWDSADFVRDLDKVRQKYKVENVICWLDYAASADLANQLNEVRLTISKLLPGDIIKVTLPANPSTLVKGNANDPELHSRRLEILRTRLLGTQFLPEGISADQMTERRYPEVLAYAFRRAVSEAMQGNIGTVFQPLGSYIYRDTTQMITFTSILLRDDEVQDFVDKSGITDFELAGSSWQLQRIEVPDLSLREKLRLDQVILTRKGKKKPTTVQSEMRLKFDADAVESRKMIADYIKFYRYYPHYYRVTF